MKHSTTSMDDVSTYFLNILGRNIRCEDDQKKITFEHKLNNSLGSYLWNIGLEHLSQTAKLE